MAPWALLGPCFHMIRSTYTVRDMTLRSRNSIAGANTRKKLGNVIPMLPSGLDDHRVSTVDSMRVGLVTGSWTWAMHACDLN